MDLKTDVKRLNFAYTEVYNTVPDSPRKREVFRAVYDEHLKAYRNGGDADAWIQTTKTVTSLSAKYPDEHPLLIRLLNLMYTDLYRRFC